MRIQQTWKYVQQWEGARPGRAGAHLKHTNSFKGASASRSQLSKSALAALLLFYIGYEDFTRKL